MAARRYPTADPTTDDAVARLARQVADLEHELNSLDRVRDDVAAHTRAITRLADALHTTTTTSAASAPAGPPAPRAAENGNGGTGGSGGGGRRHRRRRHR